MATNGARKASVKVRKKAETPEGAPPEESFEVPASADLSILRRPGPLVRRLHQIAVSVFLNHARDFDLTPIQYGSMQLVAMFPGIHQAGLGQLLALDRQTVSNVVQRLIDKGLLIRKEKNARTSALFTTGAARALIHVMQERLAIVDDVILGPLQEKEKQTFMNLLEKLVEGNNELSRAPGGNHMSTGQRRAKKAAPTA